MNKCRKDTFFLTNIQEKFIIFYISSFNSSYKATGPKCQYLVFSVANFFSV